MVSTIGDFKGFFSKELREETFDSFSSRENLVPPISAASLSQFPRRLSWAQFSDPQPKIFNGTRKIYIGYTEWMGED